MSEMSFFAGSRRGPTSLLPSISPRPRPRKSGFSVSTPSSSFPPSYFLHSSRRRTTFLSLFSSPNSLFVLALAVSIIFFLFVFLQFGFPLFSSRTISTSRHSTSIPRPTRLRRAEAIRNGAAAVDITTKDLYDRIAFADVDGGAWKQGWEVKYAGDEWDNEKLKVFVVPHSHNDPGWKLTVEEYYNKQSKHILDTIVEALSKDRRRKFIWEEISYLERWWREAPTSKKESFTKLVKDGQLEIVGGGWVMNDEANSHYFALIEQMMEGNLWLNDTIGVVPKNAWAIDPFGYSATMAYLLRRMGFQNMLIQRTHYELKKELSLHKNLEYVWRQSWDVEETTDMFVHMMPFYSYDIPHTCGPEPAICCQFDFARMWGFNYEACPWRKNPVEINGENVQERATLLLDQYKKKSTLYRTNTLLIPLGDDFRYISMEETEVQFRNYEKIFDYINSNHNMNTEVQFGTLDDYFQTLRGESERVNYSRPGEIGSGEIRGFPSLSGDFFTYADRQQDYWSGYYVSRPFFKAVDRVLEQTLRASEMLVGLVLGYCQDLPCAKLPFSFSHKLIAARRNLALFQHHDGVTGTAKNHVVEDYGTRMHTSLHDLQLFMSKAIEVLLDRHHEKPDAAVRSIFEPELLRSRYDAQPMHRSLNVLAGKAHSVVFFNPLEQTREEIVMVIVDSPDVCVLMSNLTCVESQISPEWQHDSIKLSSGRHRLYWRVTVPPMGLQTYYIGNEFAGCGKAKPAILRLYSDAAAAFACPTPYVCSKQVGDIVEINNHLQTLTFDVRHGFLQKTRFRDGSEIILGEEIGMYSSSGSGAYLFKPTGEARLMVDGSGHLIICQGPLVQEVHSYPKTTWKNPPISHSTRIYSGEGTVQGFVIEKEYHVELLGQEFNDRELMARYKTSIDNKRVFYSDLNGFQMSRRETYDKIPIQGNYYPMPSLAFLQDMEGRRFSIHSRQSLGSASLKTGWVEIMLDRRLRNDDDRGLGQGVMDNRPMNVIFHILTEFNTSIPTSTSSELPLQPSLLSHLVGAHLNYPMHAFVSKEQQKISVHSPPKSFSPLKSSLPCNLHIVSFKVPRPLKFTHMSPADLRFALIFQRRGWDSSYCKKSHLQCSNLGDQPVNLFFMFKDLAVSSPRATSLNLLNDDTEMLGYIEQQGDVAQEGHILIPPMEIQAYKLDVHDRTASS